MMTELGYHIRECSDVQDRQDSYLVIVFPDPGSPLLHNEEQ
jgi:hypothetical protein